MFRFLNWMQIPLPKDPEARKLVTFAAETHTAWFLWSKYTECCSLSPDHRQKSIPLLVAGKTAATGRAEGGAALARDLTAVQQSDSDIETNSDDELYLRYGVCRD